MTNFKNTRAFKVGKLGEEIAEMYYKDTYGNNVIRFPTREFKTDAQIRNYERQYGDCEIKLPNNNIAFLADVKTDEEVHTTGNFFAETWSNKIEGPYKKRGWFFNPESKYHCYIVVVWNNLAMSYVVGKHDMYDLVNQNRWYYETKECKKGRGLNLSEGILVPLSDIKELDSYDNINLSKYQEVVDEFESKEASFEDASC